MRLLPLLAGRRYGGAGHQSNALKEEGDDEESRLGLMRVGLDNIVGFLKAGMSPWINDGLPFERTVQLFTEDVRNRSKDKLVLAVRSEVGWKEGHIEGATHLMLGDLTQQVQRLPEDVRSLPCAAAAIDQASQQVR